MQNEWTVTQAKNSIAAIRKKLNNSMLQPSERQSYLDQINELNRYIEDKTRKERRVVPVKNAPVVANRTTVAVINNRRRSFAKI